MEKMHYTNAELEEFKQILLQKKELVIGEIDSLKTSVFNENDVADTSPTFKVLEEGANTLQKESNQMMILRQQSFLKKINQALVRIELKTYGICCVTGKLIPKERLRGCPIATMIVEAKATQKV